MEKIVIIGGGLGGLTSGALLAKEGYKVTLLEQHNIVGGCATVFKRKGGFTCEVGLHEMDGVYTNPVIQKIFEKLGVYENVEFIKPNEFFKVYTHKGEFIMPDSKEEAKTALKARFTDDTRAIEKYFKILDDISKCYARLEDIKWYQIPLFPIFFYPIVKYKNKTVSEVLDTLTDNDELKLILNTNVQYYDYSPKTLSFLLHAEAQSSYFKGGGYFIKGGSYQLSRYLAKVIEDNQGEVITKAEVIKASSSEVTYKQKEKEFTIQTDKIISNIAPKDTYRLFNMQYKESKQIAESIITIYLGFHKNLQNIYGKQAYSNFILNELTSAKDLDTMVEKDVNERGFVFVDYSQIDSGLVEESKSFGVVCMMDKLQNWENLDKEQYKEKKEKLLQTVLNKLENYYPNIKELIEYAEVATPKTMVRYIKSPNGTAYGYKATPKQFFRIPKFQSEKIDNLYFVGKFVIAGGFSPAITSGAMCYEKIIKNKMK